MASHGVDFKDYNSALLLIAIKSSHPDIVKCLLDRSLNLSMAMKKNLMSFAMKSRDLRMIDCLIQLGEDINVDDFLREFTGYDPWNFNFYVDKNPEDKLLYLAADNGCLSLVQYLISRGANVNAKWRRRKAWYCFPLTMSYFMKGFEDLALIGVATKKGHLDIVKYLLNHGAILDEAHEEGLLCIATKTGDFALVRHLINFGTTIDTGRHNTLLLLAAKYGHLEIVKYLVTMGIDVNGDLIDPITIALIQSSGFFRSLDCYRDILSLRELPDIPHSMSLYIAAENGHFDVFKYLLDHGAHMNPYDDSILCVSWENGHHRITDYLVSHGHNHSGIAAIIARERYQLGRRLLAKLQKSHQRLTDESCSESVSVDFASFAARLGTCESLWKKGIAVIRNFTDGHLPSELMDVVSCLLVANAMRSTVSDPSRLCSKKE